MSAVEFLIPVVSVCIGWLIGDAIMKAIFRKSKATNINGIQPDGDVRPMERLVIIDHADHTLYIEDVDEKELQEKYGGEEERYIEDNYTFENGYSWDYVTNIQYIPQGESTPYDVEPTDLI